MKDLLVLTADKNALFLIESFLERINSGNVFTYKVISHPGHDCGVIKKAAEFVRPFINEYNYLITIFDYEGCGDNATIMNIENKVITLLSQNGWQDKNDCLVIDPEIDLWVWVNECYLRKISNWTSSQSIYDFLKQNGFSFNSQNKPDRPKEAFEFLLRKQQIPRSSSLYKSLAKIANYKKCTEKSFNKFYSIVSERFHN